MRLPKMLFVLAVAAMFGGLPTAVARTLSESEAREVATQCLVSHGLEANVVRQPVAAGTATARRAPGAAPAFYVFNNEVAGRAHGFVIVSGDDRAVPVLGFSDSGAYDSANVPPAMQAWLEFLAAEINALGDDNGSDDNQPNRAPKRALGGKITPMLTCNWNQGVPYNGKLPMFEDIDKRAVTGCVATAMAQVMYYHRWPASSTAIPAYTTETLKITRPALPETTFDWANMKDNYSESDAGTAANAVAQLMLYCGQAVQMDYKYIKYYEDGKVIDYDPTSSALASDIPEVFQKYFNYAPSIRYAKRNSYSKDDWECMLYAELKAGRPVIYGGHTMDDSGHGFVCDGYDNKSGLFHINWGWGSESINGYFALSALTTELQGSGGSDDIEGYIKNQDMVLGIQPNDQSATVSTAMTIYSLEVPTKSFARDNAESNFKNVKINAVIYNLTGSSQNVSFGWALYHGDNRLSVMPYEKGKGIINYLDGAECEDELNFGSDLADGNYRLVPMSRILPDGEWEVCEGGDVNYIEAIIAPTSLNLVLHGINGSVDYKVNDVTYDGFLHRYKTIKVIADITNNGTSMNDYIFLFVDGVKTTMEMLDINPGETGKVTFFYRPESVGTKQIQISLNSDGTNPLFTNSIQVTEMPSSDLRMEHKVDGLQIKSGYLTLMGNTATVNTTVNNIGSATYNEEVIADLYHATVVYDTSVEGIVIRTVSRPLNLNAHSATTFTLNFNDLIDGEIYWINYYYFSLELNDEGELVETKVPAGSTKAFIVERKQGDVNGDNTRDVEDMNLIINIMVKKALKEQWPWADVNGDGVVDVDDLNPVVNVMVGKGTPEPKTFRLPTGESFNMMPVKGGLFQMGANSGDSNAASNEKPAHWVALSDFSIGETEVTQELWQAVMGSNPSYFSPRKDYTNNLQRPVENVSWEDCQTFITKLNQLTGQHFRLPTEAEWEYAARGYMVNKYAGSNDIDEVAWYKVNAYDVGSESADYGTHCVGTKSPNELGIYDMSGNVREWCGDWFGTYGSGGQANPTGPAEGTKRVNRGGSWGNFAKDCRTTARNSDTPQTAVGTMGLRLAMTDENRINNVIPKELRDKMAPYMPIYDGNTPPNIEGEYFNSPLALVYDSSNQYDVGDIFADMYLKFSNQDMLNNTLDYDEVQGSSETTGKGCFISGMGNNFTVFFNAVGVSHYSDYDITTNEALVISGTKDEQGIRDLRYAFVMVDKTDDPHPYIVPAGVFRVFGDQDGLSEFTTWSAAKRGLGKRTQDCPMKLEWRSK
ncbi:MAG: C10 family peptidase [Muribaculaceae bacterium]|nr:C10 family peptidase [Muribaculaceae bacterium]